MNTDTMRTEELIRTCMKKLEDDFGTLFTEEEFENTPRRIFNVFREFSENQKFEFTTFANEDNYNQMVVLKVDKFYSLCSHHLLPFFGCAYIGYIPQDRVCGISKLDRMIKKYASRPQIQERLTEQIKNELTSKLGTNDVMVVLKAKHLCMEMRGTKATNPLMITSAISGAFWKPEVRTEFYKLTE